MLETLAHRCKMYAWQKFYGLVCYVNCQLLQKIDCFALQGAVALSKSSNRSDESDSLGLSTTDKDLK